MRKILKGKKVFEESPIGGYQLQLNKIAEVWDSDKYNDYGILRIFRLFIVTVLLFFPGVLIDEIFKSKGTLNRKLIVELYVVLKIIFPVLILCFGWYNNSFIIGLAVYLLLETYIYLFSKIFLEVQHITGANIRTLLLLVLNYFESGLTFAAIYMGGNYLNMQMESAIEAVYFSFITSATVGYGDIHPGTNAGRILSMIQIFSSISFFVLFFNFFSGKTNQQD
ncbi:MAG: two pore domain potassium channel family protein [Oligoflexus sp.]|nr:two pore domain potassium channel family protein [Pseudopedobacter sp.]